MNKEKYKRGQIGLINSEIKELKSTQSLFERFFKVYSKIHLDLIKDLERAKKEIKGGYDFESTLLHLRQNG